MNNQFGVNCMMQVATLHGVNYMMQLSNVKNEIEKCIVSIHANWQNKKHSGLLEIKTSIGIILHTAIWP